MLRPNSAGRAGSRFILPKGCDKTASVAVGMTNNPVSPRRASYPRGGRFTSRAT
jgi:hypothetical protein